MKESEVIGTLENKTVFTQRIHEQHRHTKCAQTSSTLPLSRLRHPTRIIPGRSCDFCIEDHAGWVSETTTWWYML